MPEAHEISVRYLQSEVNDLNNTLQERIRSFPELFFCWTPQNQIL